MLSKLRIEAYSDKEYRIPSGLWIAQINPERYSTDYRTHFTEDRGIDSSSVVSRYQSQAPQRLSFDFTLDASKSVSGLNEVALEAEALKAVVYNYNGESHSQNYLKVIWGTLIFQCMLEHLNVEFVRFDPSGVPIRAKVQTSFKQHQTPEQIARRANKKSADLTHSRVIRQSMTLPHVCFEIYQDPEYYAAVARANDLDDLSRLMPGTHLRLPPTEA